MSGVAERGGRLCSSSVSSGWDNTELDAFMGASLWLFAKSFTKPYDGKTTLV
jgi:hypothetical protein